jgi:hypothetical protein
LPNSLQAFLMKHKPRIRIVDTAFAHAPNSWGTGDLNLSPTHFEWHRGEQISDLVVVTESCFHLVDTLVEKHKIALILEPACIQPKAYEEMKAGLWQKFEFVLTHDDELLNAIPNGWRYVFGGSWIRPADRQIYPKTKGISIIASEKNFAPGHKMRHEIIKRFGDRIDVYGRGYKPIENKIEGLRDYRYHIVVENTGPGTFLTEKLLDAFATGCIPIYCGAKWQAYDLFHGDGVLFFDDLPQFEQCLNITSEYRHEEHDAVRRNFNLAKYYFVPEDALYKQFIEPVLKPFAE